MFPTCVEVSLLGKVLEFKLLNTLKFTSKHKHILVVCSGMWYKSTTTTHKGCCWNCLSYSVLMYAKQCYVNIYYSNFFLFPSCHSCSCGKPRFEHVNFFFPLIWHITLIFVSCLKVYRQIRLDAKIGSMIDIWGGRADVDASFNFTQSKVSISLFFFHFFHGYIYGNWNVMLN
jgi:hypothetical protein